MTYNSSGIRGTCYTSTSYDAGSDSGSESPPAYSRPQRNTHSSLSEHLRPRPSGGGECSGASGVFPRQTQQLGAYLVGRRLVGRLDSDTQVARLKEANDTIHEVRETLSFGRGNVSMDLDMTNGESGQRVAAGRVLTNRLRDSGAALGVTHTVAMAELVKAGLCSEHGDVSVHRHIPKLAPGDQVHKVANPASDHGWAEWRRPGSPLKNAIVMDAWAEGPAIFAEDGKYTNPGVPDENRVSRYAYGPALGRRASSNLQQAKERLSGLANHVDQARQSLVNSGYTPEKESIWPPEPVISPAFAQRVQRDCGGDDAMDAALAVAYQLGSPSVTSEFNAALLLDLAADLTRAPQNPLRSDMES